MPDPGLDHRAETARRNGALSRGPVTEAGKARSARNAVRHGLSARSLPEPAAGGALAALHGALLARWQPWDAAEAHLVEELLCAYWRQARLRALEEMVLVRLRRGEPLDRLPSLATVLRYRGRIDRALARTTQELQALQARRDRIADPARLRWLADQIERLQTAGAGGTNEPTGSSSEANFTNELQPSTNEPAENVKGEKYTNEFLSSANEPSRPTPRLNRRQRRRQAALARRQA